MVGQFPAGVKIRIGCLNLALFGAQKWAEMLHHPSIHYWVLLKKLPSVHGGLAGRGPFTPTQPPPPPSPGKWLESARQWAPKAFEANFS